MTIKYCSWATGSDTTGDGSNTLPYKTIDKASTGLTGGDEVRVEKSPDPTSLTGTFTFTGSSTTVTGIGTLFTTELVIGDYIEGPDGYWWEVVTISSNTSATLYKKYSGTTQSGVSSRKLGITSTGAAATNTTAVQSILSNGTTTAMLSISGGWDLSTQTQTGKTYFKQVNGTFANRYGYGIYVSAKSYISVSMLSFLRYYTGIYLYNSNNITISSSECLSSANNGIYCYYAPKNIKLISPICNANGYFGIQFYNNTSTSSGVNSVILQPVCNSNANSGLNLSNASNNYILSPTVKYNGNYGILFENSFDNIINGTITTANNNIALYVSYGNCKIYKANLSEVTKFNGAISYGNSYISVDNLNGYSYIYTDYGTIISQNATAGGTGKEWKFSPSGAARNSIYPLVLSIAKFAVASSGQVTVTVYFKKSGTGVAGALRCRYGQVAWSEAAQDIVVNCPDNTNRNQVTLQFTPTESGVIEIEALAWYVSSTSDTVIIDDINITQA